MSSGSAITSPRLMPMRRLMRSSSVTSWVRRLIPNRTPAAPPSAAALPHTAADLHQHAVAGIFDNAAVMFADLRVQQLAAMRHEAPVRALFIRPHQARVADHVGAQNRGKAAGRGHGWQGQSVINEL